MNTLCSECMSVATAASNHDYHELRQRNYRNCNDDLLHFIASTCGRRVRLANKAIDAIYAAALWSNKGANRQIVASCIRSIDIGRSHCIYATETVKLAIRMISSMNKHFCHIYKVISVKSHTKASWLTSGFVKLRDPVSSNRSLKAFKDISKNTQSMILRTHTLLIFGILKLFP